MGADEQPFRGRRPRNGRGSVLDEVVSNTHFSSMRSHRSAQATENLRALDEAARRTSHSVLRGAIQNPECRRFFSLLFGNSPYLARILPRDPPFAQALVDIRHENLIRDIPGRVASVDPEMRRDRIMQLLRRQRRASVAFVVMDAFGVPHNRRGRSLEGPRLLSDLADLSVAIATEHLLSHRVERGELAPPADAGAGKRWEYFVLAVGEHGGRELGFSSGLRLIALYDARHVRYRGTRTPDDCFGRVTRDMARMLQARTRDGIAFRADLRMRPGGPNGAVAINTDAALAHYVGARRTWERATLINARPVAGDIASAGEFLAAMTPFIWDEGLDFRSVEDIRSIRRQIRSYHRRRGMRTGRPDLELGPGGIRDIEFLVQMHQLAYGGRSQRLRGSGVLPMLGAIEQLYHLLPREAKTLTQAYGSLRQIRNAVQAIHNHPTRSLPASHALLDNVACLMNLDSGDTVREAANAHMAAVHGLFEALFRGPGVQGSIGPLLGETGDGSATRQALAEAGFSDPLAAQHVIRGWMTGAHPATRSTRNRAALRDLLDDMVGAFTKSCDPDRALRHLDALVRTLPPDTGVIALLHAHSWLLNMIARVMSESSALTAALLRQPRTLEAAVDPGFFLPVPACDELRSDLSRRTQVVARWDQLAPVVAQWTEERRFQIGVQLLQNLMTAQDAGHHLADIA